MKVAVCFSGLSRGDPDFAISVWKKTFPEAGFFYSAWDTSPDLPVDTKVRLFAEPLQRYHPLTQDMFPDWYTYGTRKDDRKFNIGHYQVLAHAQCQMFLVPDEYDMIIRARWDIIPEENEDWTGHLNRCYNENTVLGFRVLSGVNRKGYGKHNRHLSEILGGNHHQPDMVGLCLLQDSLLIFPRKLFDPAKVFDQYQNKKLRGNEFGWTQALIENNNFYCKWESRRFGIYKVHK